MYKVNEYIVRVLDYMLANIECEKDLYEESFINIREFREIYNYKGGDLYDQIYRAVKELKDIKIYLDNNRKINIFERIQIGRGVVEYSFSDDFIQMNYKGGKLNYFELNKIVRLRTFRAKRLYEILYTYKFSKWRVSNEEIQKILYIPYNVYSDIKRHVIDVSIKDINAIYDMQINYVPIRKGSKIIGVEFNIN